MVLLITSNTIYGNGLLTQLQQGNKQLFSQVAAYGQNIVNYLHNQAAGIYASGQGNEGSDANLAALAAKQLDNSFYNKLGTQDASTTGGQWINTYPQNQINAITGGLMNLLTQVIQVTSTVALQLSKPTPNFSRRPQGNTFIPKGSVPSGSGGSYQLFSAQDTRHNQYTQYYYAWEMGPQMAALAAFIVWLADGTFDNYTQNMQICAQQAFAMDNQIFAGNGNMLQNIGIDLRSLSTNQLASISNETMTTFVDNVWNLLIAASQGAGKFQTPTIVHFSGNYATARIDWFLSSSMPFSERGGLAWNNDITRPQPTMPVPPGVSEFHMSSNQEDCIGIGPWKNVYPNMTYIVSEGGGFESWGDFGNINSDDPNTQYATYSCVSPWGGGFGFMY